MLIMLHILWFALLEKQGGCWDIFTRFGFHTQNEPMKRFTIADTGSLTNASDKHIGAG